MARIERMILPLLLAACAGQDKDPSGDTGSASTQPEPAPTQPDPGGTPGTEAPASDLDGDGFAVEDGDCDDAAVDVFPDATDTFGDGIDQDCDGADGVDADGDSYASIDSGGDDCDDGDAALTPVDNDGDNASICDGDCDDADVLVRPGLAETCDGLDNDCLSGVDLDVDGVDVCIAADAFIYGGQADILFVIDNSCSMATEQAQLANNGAALIAPLVGADYQLGVITTDMNNVAESGKLQLVDGVRWIDGTWAQADAEIWFDVAMVRGTTGSGIEKGVDATYAAIDGAAAGFNAGFVRADAALHVVVLSDETDASGISLVDFHAWFSAFKAAVDKVGFHSIVSPDPPCPTAASVGKAYAEISSLAGGIVESVCVGDYGPALASIAAEIALTAGTTDQVVDLSELPDVATLTVAATTPDGTVIVLGAADYLYDAVENTIEILGVWELGTSFAVDYRIVF